MKRITFEVADILRCKQLQSAIIASQNMQEHESTSHIRSFQRSIEHITTQLQWACFVFLALPDHSKILNASD